MTLLIQLLQLSEFMLNKEHSTLNDEIINNRFSFCVYCFFKIALDIWYFSTHNVVQRNRLLLWK